MAKKTTESTHLLLKLRSGDEIVAKKISTTPTGLVLSRPLQLQRSVMFDPLTGNIKKNICIFRDWLEFTTSLECNVPNDFIIVASSATPDLIKRYTDELTNLDRPKGKPVPPPVPPNNPAPSDPNDSQEFERLMKMLAGGKPTQAPPNIKGLENLVKGEDKIPSLGQQGSDMVSINIQMPYLAFMELMFALPMFDMIQEGPMEGTTDDDDEDFDSDNDEGDSHPKTTPPPPKPQAKKKPKPNQGEEPPDGWQGRFGFPK